MKDNKPASCNSSWEADSITVADALAKILDEVQASSAFNKLPLRDCLHRTVFADINSPMNVPAHDNSAMDGYAVGSDDFPQDQSRRYRVIGTAYAGQTFSGPCGNGECVRIMTGATLPEGCDSIVIQEEVRQIDDDFVEIDPGQRQHQNVRFAGEDIKRGETVLERGHVIGAADLGVLASLGLAECRVFRRPRVAFFSTGDELKSVGEVLGKGEIYDSNRYSLYGLLAQCEVDIIDMGVVRDAPKQIRAALLSAASAADVVLTSGGVSVGEADYIKTVLDEIGSMNFWKIAMKPGRPLTFGKIDDALFFGLPGNPVAVMVTFFQFVLPCLQKMSGRAYRAPLSHVATSQSKIRKNPGRREYQRAIAEQTAGGRLQVRLTGKQGSGILSSMKLANCFIVLPEEQGAVAEGDEVQVEFFRDYF